jgi:hypothetical protein
MKGSKPVPLVGLGLILYALLMTACGGKTPQNGPPALNILTPSTLPTAAEGDAYQLGMVATGGQLPYTWTIDSGALPAGLTLTTEGVLSGTPPAGSAGTYGFTVRVTDSQSPVKAFQVASLTLMVNPPLSFTASALSNAVIAVAYSVTVMATGGVTMTPNCGGYTYALAPGSSPLPAGLTLSSSGTISGTPTGPIGTFPFTVQVTDCFPTTATANFSITVTGKIQGNYVFSFNGYNQQGQAFYMAGGFSADGNGNITSGVFDRNGDDSVGPMTSVAMTAGTGGSGQCPAATDSPSGSGSVYCVGRPGVTGGSNLGTIVITSAPGTYSFSVSVSLVSDSRIILADPNHPDLWGSGTLKTQGSLSGVSLASGSFGFGLYGIDSGGNRYGGAGYFITDSGGNITSGNGETDINDNGAVQSQETLTGSITPTVDPLTGRGTATFSVGSTTFDYAFYVVPAAPGRLFFPALVAVQTDPISSTVPVTLASIVERGPANSGTSAFTNLNLNATRGSNPNGSVFELNSVSTSGGTPAPDISLGLGNFDGAGNVTSYIFDENNGGNWTTPVTNTFTGTYSVDPNNKLSGRVKVTGIPGNPVWYLTASNTGFVVGTDSKVTVGTFEPQTVPTPVTILALFGNFYGGTSDPVLPSVTNLVEAVVATPPPPPGVGNGTITTTYDSSGSGVVMMNQVFGPAPPSGQAGPGGFCLADDKPCPSTQQAQSSTGRLLIQDNSGNPVDVLYIISGSAAGATNTNTKSVTMSTGAQPSLSVIVH